MGSVPGQSPCVTCGKEAASMCSHCLRYYYCGVKCQEADWQFHRFDCVPRLVPYDFWVDTSPVLRPAFDCEPQICRLRTARSIQLPAPKLQLAAKREYVPHKFYIEDLSLIQLKVGTSVELYVLYTMSITGGYIIAADFENFKFSTRFLEGMLKNFKTVGTFGKRMKAVTNSYYPSPFELCVVNNVVDGDWYRAVNLCRIDDEHFRIMFVDFGNIAKVSSRNILPMARHLMFSSVANLCYVKGIPPSKWWNLITALQKNPIIQCSVERANTSGSYNIDIKNLDKLLA